MVAQASLARKGGVERGFTHRRCCQGRFTSLRFLLPVSKGWVACVPEVAVDVVAVIVVPSWCSFIWVATFLWLVTQCYLQSCPCCSIRCAFLGRCLPQHCSAPPGLRVASTFSSEPTLPRALNVGRFFLCANMLLGADLSIPMRYETMLGFVNRGRVPWLVLHTLKRPTHSFKTSTWESWEPDRAKLLRRLKWSCHS